MERVKRGWKVCEERSVWKGNLIGRGGNWGVLEKKFSEKFRAERGQKSGGCIRKSAPG